MIKVYQDEENDYVCECWGASTKHPDSIDRFSNWEDKTDLIEEKYQIYQWLLWIASRKMFPFHARMMVDYANEKWYDIE